MANNKIAKILRDHGINYTMDNDVIIADELYTYDGKLCVDKINMTGWTKSKLYDWLGY